MNRLRRHRKEKANRNDIVHNEKGSTTTTIISSFAAGRNNSKVDSDLLSPESQASSQLGSQLASQPAAPQPAQQNAGNSPKISDFDLANALPSPDDFRTSLLMPKLSARFSMLKEQDNPQSMMGKASDDSVLFPKRASRLNIFGHPPSLLADIEEMSIHSGHQGRVDSYASGDTTDDDRSQAGSSSIMSRARRAEGNNLFGGRQKVYKIPTKASSPGGVSPNPSESSGRSRMGRPVYEHDVIPSSFATTRLGPNRDDHTGEEASLDNSPVSPMEDVFSSMGGSNRTTATTVDEQMAPSSATSDKNLSVKPLFPERGAGPNRSRRLYGQGLAQSVQNQQHSTLNRLENLSRRPATPEHPPPSMNRGYSRSATSLRDRLQKLGVDQIPSSRPSSPPLSSASPQPTPVEEDPPKELAPVAPSAPAPAPAPAPVSAPVPAPVPAPTTSSSGAPPPGGPPPLSPPISEVEDEEKKLQLQQQWPQPLAAALQPEDRGKATAAGLFNKPSGPFDESQFTRRQLQMHEGRNTPPLRRPNSPPRRAAPQVPDPAGIRSRGISNASSYRSRPGSASSHYSELQQKQSSTAGTRSRSSSVNQMGTTFFANSSPSDSGDEYEEDEYRGSMDDDDIHPALRSRTPSKPATPTHDPQDRQPPSEVRFFDLSDLNPIAEHDGETGATSDASGDEQQGGKDEDPEPQEIDSPTLGPSGLGLSGLVRTHLRQDSDTILSPRLPPSKFNPDTAAEPADLPSENPISARANESNEDEVAQTDLRPTTADSFYPNESLNEDDVAAEKHYMHQRNASTETQREREEFANELAERRKRVQEKLQGVDSRSGSRAESLAGSRSGSPAGRQTPDGVKAGNAFALLRNRNAGGKNSLFSKPPGGLGNNSNNSSSPSLFLDRDDPWREEDERSINLNASSSHLAERPSVRSRVAAIARNNSQDGSRESSRGRGVSPVSSIVSGLRSRRDRSQSDASARSKSRSRRDDLGTVEEGSVISHDTIMLPGLSYDPNGNDSVPSTRRQSLDTMSEADSSAATPVEPPTLPSNRYRSDSRAGSSGFFFDDLPPPGPPPAMIGASSPRPSPIAPYSANATPPLHEISPDPNSPPAPTFAAAASHVIPQRAPGHTGLTKRAVNKTLISEPTFVSSTSNVPTVGLPPGANLSNGREQAPSPVQAPAVPPMNPRRRRGTTTQTIMGAFNRDSSKHDEQLPPPMDRSNTSTSNPSVGSGAGSSGRGTPDDRERSVFESDSKRSMSRSRLRKTSGESSFTGRSEPPAPPPAYPPPRAPNMDMDGRMF